MYTQEELLKIYETMVKIRKFEKCVEKHFLCGDIPGFMHLYIGEEAVATGVCHNLSDCDMIASTHRGHGHTIAKGADIFGMMAELFGKKTGLCQGKGGSMHVADFKVGMLGANGVVGGGFGLSIGAAMAEKMKGTQNISVVFFGDGASNRGTFHECLNMASAMKLPTLFVCENNGIAATTPAWETVTVENIATRAAGYSVQASIADGSDVFDVIEKSRDLIGKIRDGSGPALLECKVCRFKGHFVGDPQKYRDLVKLSEQMEKMDPIKNFEVKVLKGSQLSEKQLEQVQKEVDKLIADAVEYAESSSYPDDQDLYTDVL